MPVNPSSDPSVTLPNVHIKTSFLMALMAVNRQHWQASRRCYHRVECQAKKQYFNQVVMKASKIAMCGGPKEAWEAVRLLEKGSTAHH
jgi:hypothetical protein